MKTGKRSKAMRMSEWGSLEGCASEDAVAYRETHLNEQLTSEQIEQLAEQESHAFVAEQKGYGDVVSEEDRVLYRQHFKAAFLRTLETEVDMWANPQDYGMTRREVKKALGK